MRNATFISALLISLFSFPSYLMAEASPTFDLYAAYALTGIGATFGNVEVKGSKLAIEDFNRENDLDGKKVRLVVEDTQSTNVGTLNAMRKLVSLNGAMTMLGPTWLDSYQSLLPVADRDGLFIFTPSGSSFVYKKSPDQYPLVFSTWFNLELEVELLLKHVQQQKNEQIVLVFDQDPFFQAIRNIIQRKAAGLGLQIVSDESFDLQTSDFRSVLTKVNKRGADGALFGFGDENNLFTFLKQRRELAPTLPLYGTDYVDGYASQERWLPFLNNVDFISTQVRNKDFAETYEARYNSPPVLSASTAYDATAILLQALKETDRSPEAIRSYLLSREFDTKTFGKVKLDDTGAVQSSDFSIKKVRGGTIALQPTS